MSRPLFNEVRLFVANVIADDFTHSYDGAYMCRHPKEVLT